VGRTVATCIGCGATAELSYIRAEGRAGRMGSQLMATVAAGNRTRIYLEPTPEHEAAAKVERPSDAPDGEIATNPRWFSTPAFGMTEFADVFTARQLTALTTFSDLVAEAREHILADARAAGMPNGEHLEAGGTGAAAYADAVATYLGLAMSGPLARNCTIATWDSGPTGTRASTGGSARTEHVRSAFARQALPMSWDFAEANIIGVSGASYVSAFKWVLPAIERLWAGEGAGYATQADAATLATLGYVISTDPPYYDNIGYSDLSDFFYVWLRRSVRSIHPELLSTMLVPKAEELVANPYRHGGRDGAHEFFEDGFREVFRRARESALPDFPITVYYAFKQSKTTEVGGASTGWETLLEGMIRSGWSVTATWPIRSELSNRMIGSGTNALASSIVLALRPRPEDAPRTDRRRFIATLKAELPEALKELQQGAIAPVDLPQAAIGPGMAVFSRYSAVLEPDGSTMSVRAALTRINETLDQVLNEQEGDFVAATRFAIAWYRQHGYGVGTFGDANNLANARNTSVDAMAREGVLTSRASKVQLIKPADLNSDYDVVADPDISGWEVLHHLIKVLERDGVAPAGDFLHAALSRSDGAVDADLVKELAHLLFRIAEGNGWTKDALSFNSLVTSWPEIIDVARAEQNRPVSSQGSFDYDTEDN
ncbi:MAG: DUF1156 domain-containing protein, partial [Mycobacterium sp.]